VVCFDGVGRCSVGREKIGIRDVGRKFTGLGICRELYVYRFKFEGYSDSRLLLEDLWRGDSDLASGGLPHS